MISLIGDFILAPEDSSNSGGTMPLFGKSSVKRILNGLIPISLLLLAAVIFLTALMRRGDLSSLHDDVMAEIGSLKMCSNSISGRLTQMEFAFGEDCDRLEKRIDETILSVEILRKTEGIIEEVVSLQALLSGMEPRFESSESSALAAEYDRLGGEAFKDGRYEDAAAYFKASWERDPEPALYPLNYAKALKASPLPIADSTEIRRGVYAALEKNPFSDEALQLAYDMALETGDSEEAIVLGTTLLKIDPDDVELTWDLGRLNLQYGNPENAAALLRTVSELRPDDDAPPSLLGNAFYELGKYDDAERAYLESLKRNPRNLVSLNGLGCLEFEDEMYEAALVYWTKSAGIRSSPALHEKIGRAYQSLGEGKRAIDAWNRSITITELHTQDDIDNVVSRCADIAEEYLRLNEPEKSLEYTRKGLSLENVERLRTIEIRASERLERKR